MPKIANYKVRKTHRNNFLCQINMYLLLTYYVHINIWKINMVQTKKYKF